VGEGQRTAGALFFVPVDDGTPATQA
jgi:hypothetical protein